MGRRMIRNQDGAVLIIVAVTLPLMILLGSFVLDIGNWWVHKRHLQVQADAAALAGARYIQQFCDNNAVAAEARKYSGDVAAAGQYNPQLGKTPDTRVQFRLNSRYWGRSHTDPLPQNSASSPVDTDFSAYSAPIPFPGGVSTPATADQPCARTMVDVKMTENDLPWFFKLAQWFGDAADFDVDFENTQARVEVRKLGAGNGFLPVGVRDSTPKKAKVIFVDEDKAEGAAGRILGQTELYDSGRTDLDGLAIWDNATLSCDKATPPNCGAAAAVQYTVPHIGVRIVLSGTSAAGWDDCVNPGTLTQCFDAGTTTPSSDGLRYIRGYNTTGTDPKPRLAQVDLGVLGGGGPNSAYCTGLEPTASADAYFLGSGLNLASPNDCDIQVTATLVPGTGVPARDYLLTAHITGPNLATPINEPVAQQGNTTTFRTGNNKVKIPPESGPVSVRIDWVQTGTIGGCNVTPRPASCSGSFEGGSVITRAFAPMLDRSGPIEKVLVTPYGSTTHVNSVPRCATGCAGNLYVAIGLSGSIRLSGAVTDKATVLRFGSQSGSQNGALDCDPAIAKLEDEIAQGCAPPYTPNQGRVCEATRADLWDNAAPWDCIAVEPGDKTNQIPRGLNLRLFGDEAPGAGAPCPYPNLWRDTSPVDGRPDYQPDDKRIIPMFVVPFSSFRTNGFTDKTVPVIDFAAFYVTGWAGSGKSTQAPTACGNEVVPRENRAYIVGHFIQYVVPSGSGTPGNEQCNLSGTDLCIPVMTK